LVHDWTPPYSSPKQAERAKHYRGSRTYYVLADLDGPVPNARPEELNRKVVDHLSDINMTLTEHARRYLLAEGFPADRTIKVGSHMQEILEHFMPKIRANDAPTRLGLTPGRFFLVSLHREENVDTPQNLLDMIDTLNGLVETYGFDVIVSTHPRTRTRLEALGQYEANPKIRFLRPFGFLDYVKLQMEAACVLSDSGTITEEASLLDLPALTLRNAHERPEGMEEGTLIMTGLKRQSVLDCLRVVMAQKAAPGRTTKLVPDYEGGKVSQKILRIVLSYTDFVNRVVWRTPT
jgi:UDP-N-acetylglucosamine 2-epimerase (non-hydrolysing)